MGSKWKGLTELHNCMRPEWPFALRRTSIFQGVLLHQVQASVNPALLPHHSIYLSLPEPAVGLHLVLEAPMGSRDVTSKLRQRVWDGSIPLEIVLHKGDCRTYDESDPYLVNSFPNSSLATNMC